MEKFRIEDNDGNVIMRGANPIGCAHIDELKELTKQLGYMYIIDDTPFEPIDMNTDGLILGRMWEEIQCIQRGGAVNDE